MGPRRGKDSRYDENRHGRPKQQQDRQTNDGPEKTILPSGKEKPKKKIDKAEKMTKPMMSLSSAAEQNENPQANFMEPETQVNAARVEMTEMKPPKAEVDLHS